MSSFYYCNDCKKPVDLIEKHEAQKHVNCELDYCYTCDGGLFVCKFCNLAEAELKDSCIKRCKECGGTNWHAMIDSPGGYPKIHPGSTHRVGDIEKLNHSKEILKIFGIGKE